MDRGLADARDDGGPNGVAPVGAAFSAVARPSRSTPAAISLASLAVLAIAILTKQPDLAASVPTVDVTAQPQRAEAAASPPGPAIAPGPSPTSGPPSFNPTVTPNPTPTATPAEIGTNHVVPAGQGSPRITVVLGGGWARTSDATFTNATGVAPAGMTIGAWSLQHVNTFPCRWSAPGFADEQLMRTAAGQARALASWWGQDPGMPPDSNATIAPVATNPQPTTLAGYPAWSLEILVPSDFDMTECDGGQLVFWDAANGDVRYGLGPGELIRVWVVDLDGQPIVIEGSTFLAGLPEYVNELDEVFDSIVIEPGVG